MYLKSHLIPNNKDEWIKNLHLEDGTKIEAKVIKTYKETYKVIKEWSEELNNCPFTIGNMKFNDKSK